MDKNEKLKRWNELNLLRGTETFGRKIGFSGAGSQEETIRGLFTTTADLISSMPKSLRSQYQKELSALYAKLKEVLE